MSRKRSLLPIFGIVVFALSIPLGVALAGDPLAGVRQATVQYHDIEAAGPDGYAEFYVCTDNEGLDAAMGQHYANVPEVLNPAIDALAPEVLVYEPKRGGGYRLAGVEWVVFKADWDALHANPPQLFGQTFATIPVGNRYGLPPFYELHAWVWKGNPRGVFDDWNPTVSCLGEGDPA